MGEGEEEGEGSGGEGGGGRSCLGFPPCLLSLPRPGRWEGARTGGPGWSGLDNSCTKTLGFGKEAERGDWQASGGLPVPFSQGPPPDERAAPDGFDCWNLLRQQCQPFPPLSTALGWSQSPRPQHVLGANHCPLGSRSADWQPRRLQREGTEGSSKPWTLDPEMLLTPQYVSF